MADDHCSGGMCPADKTMKLIGGKWKVPILYFLWNGTRRFGELKASLPEASPKVLTEHLRQMEADGLLTRKIYAEVPPRVEYSLTARGRSLKPVVDAMVKWAKGERK